MELLVSYIYKSGGLQAAPFTTLPACHPICVVVPGHTAHESLGATSFEGSS